MSLRRLLNAATVIVAFALIWLVEDAAWAQEPQVTTTVRSVEPRSGLVVEQIVPVPRVIAATSSNPSDPHGARLGDRLTVEVRGMSELLRDQAGDCRRVLLFLDGREMSGVPNEACEEATGRVRFHLDRNETSEEAWRDVLGGPFGTSRPVAVSVGFAGGFPAATDVDDLQLDVVPQYLFLLFLALLAMALVAFLVLARTTPMLRDRNASVPDGTAPRPFSLALTQMSVWLFLVVTAFVFLWLVTGRLDNLSSTALILVGLGSLTALGASLIDRQKVERYDKQQTLVAAREESLQTLQSRLSADADGPDATAMRGEVVTAESALDEATTTLVSWTAPVKQGASAGFWRDILSDKNGVSLYRFQMLAWTVVLAIVFAVTVWRNLAMPDFGVVLLALMGISNGTYLGFKFPERH